MTFHHYLYQFLIWLAMNKRRLFFNILSFSLPFFLVFTSTFTYSALTPQFFASYLQNEPLESDGSVLLTVSFTMDEIQTEVKIETDSNMTVTNMIRNILREMYVSSELDSIVIRFAAITQTRPFIALVGDNGESIPVMLLGIDEDAWNNLETLIKGNVTTRPSEGILLSHIAYADTSYPTRQSENITLINENGDNLINISITGMLSFFDLIEGTTSVLPIDLLNAVGLELDVGPPYNSIVVISSEKMMLKLLKSVPSLLQGFTMRFEPLLDYENLSRMDVEQLSKNAEKLTHFSTNYLIQSFSLFEDVESVSFNPNLLTYIQKFQEELRLFQVTTIALSIPLIILTYLVTGMVTALAIGAIFKEKVKLETKGMSRRQWLVNLVFQRATEMVLAILLSLIMAYTLISFTSAMTIASIKSTQVAVDINIVKNIQDNYQTLTLLAAGMIGLLVIIHGKNSMKYDLNNLPRMADLHNQSHANENDGIQWFDYNDAFFWSSGMILFIIGEWLLPTFTPTNPSESFTTITKLIVHSGITIIIIALLRVINRAWMMIVNTTVKIAWHKSKRCLVFFLLHQKCRIPRNQLIQTGFLLLIQVAIIAPLIFVSAPPQLTSHLQDQARYKLGGDVEVQILSNNHSLTQLIQNRINDFNANLVATSVLHINLSFLNLARFNLMVIKPDDFITVAYPLWKSTLGYKWEDLLLLENNQTIFLYEQWAKKFIGWDLGFKKTLYVARNVTVTLINQGTFEFFPRITIPINQETGMRMIDVPVGVIGLQTWDYINETLIGYGIEYQLNTFVLIKYKDNKKNIILQEQLKKFLTLEFGGKIKITTVQDVQLLITNPRITVISSIAPLSILFTLILIIVTVFLINWYLSMDYWLETRILRNEGISKRFHSFLAATDAMLTFVVPLFLTIPILSIFLVYAVTQFMPINETYLPFHWNDQITIMTSVTITFITSIFIVITTVFLRPLLVNTVQPTILEE